MSNHKLRVVGTFLKRMNLVELRSISNRRSLSTRSSRKSCYRRWFNLLLEKKSLKEIKESFPGFFFFFIIFCDRFVLACLFRDFEVPDSWLVHGFLVSRETVALRRWERWKQKFGFIKRVDKSWIITVKGLDYFLNLLRWQFNLYQLVW